MLPKAHPAPCSPDARGRRSRLCVTRVCTGQGAATVAGAGARGAREQGQSSRTLPRGYSCRESAGARRGGIKLGASPASPLLISQLRLRALRFRGTCRDPAAGPGGLSPPPREAGRRRLRRSPSPGPARRVSARCPARPRCQQLVPGTRPPRAPPSPLAPSFRFGPCRRP